LNFISTCCWEVWEIPATYKRSGIYITGITLSVVLSHRLLWKPRTTGRLQTQFTKTKKCSSPVFNPLTPNGHYSGRIAPLTSKRCVLYIYSTNIGTEYFKHGIYSPFFSLQNAVCFIILTYLVPVLFTFYMQDVLKF